MSENPYWDKGLPKKGLLFKDLQSAVQKLLEAQEKSKLPCGCIPQPGLLLTCTGHSLLDEMEGPS